MWLWTVLAALLLSTTSSYRLVRMKKTWDDAEFFCNIAFTSNLASFTTVAEATNILKLAKKCWRDVWIGLNDRPENALLEGRWIFSDNTGCPLITDLCLPPPDGTFAYWAFGRPLMTAKNTNDCGSVKVWNGKKWGINKMVYDRKCKDKLYFICNEPPARRRMTDADEKVACAEAGLYLGIPHDCECIDSSPLCTEDSESCNNCGCTDDSKYCNPYEFVWDKVKESESILPGDVLCSGEEEVCCCSCQNCPDYEPFGGN